MPKLKPKPVDEDYSGPEPTRYKKHGKSVPFV